MKSRTMPPIESPDTPYAAASRRKAGEANREPAIPPYKTSLTPPNWPTELAPGSAVERKLARVEMVLEDVARREEILAAQINAHRRSVAELAEERARWDAQRSAHAEKVKLAEETLIRMREELALERQKVEDQAKRTHAGVEPGDGHEAADAKAAHEANSSHTPQDYPGAQASERVENPAPEVGELLSRLAKQAGDFAVMAGTVMEMQRQLTGERTRHEELGVELRQRDEALAQRESESAQQLNAATQQLNADRESLARAQEAFAVAKKDHAELQQKLEATEADLGRREKAHALKTEKLHEEEAALTSKRNAIASVEDGHRQREADLLRLERGVRERAVDLARREAELATSEAEIRAAGREAAAMQEAVDRLNAELDAGLAKLRSDSEAVALLREEQARISAALELRSEELAKREAAIEQVAKEAEDARQEALKLRNERLDVELKAVPLAARESALEEKRLAFDDCRRKFRERISGFMKE